MKGILFDGDVVFKDGNIATGDTKGQCIDILLNTNKGANLIKPRGGIKSELLVESQISNPELTTMVKKEVIGDGIAIAKVIANGDGNDRQIFILEK